MEQSIDEKLQRLTIKYQNALNQIQILDQAKSQAEERAAIFEEQLREELRSHESDLKEAKGEMDFLAAENHELKQYLEMINDDQVNEELTRKNSEVQMFSQKYHDLLDANYKTNERMAACEILCNKLKEELEISQDQLVQMRKFQRALENAKKKAMDDCHAAKVESQKFQEKYRKLLDDFNKFKSIQYQRETEDRAQLDEHRAILKRNANLEKYNEELEKSTKKLRQEVVIKNQRLSTLRTNNKQLQTKIEKMNKQNYEMQEEVNRLNAKISEYQRSAQLGDKDSHIALDTKISQNESRIKELVSKIEPLLQKNHTLEETIKKQFQHRKDAEIQHLKEVQKILNDTITQKDYELKYLQENLHSPPVTSGRSPGKYQMETVDYDILKRKAMKYLNLNETKVKHGVSPLKMGEVYNNAAKLASRDAKHIFSSENSISSQTLANLSPLALNMDRVYGLDSEFLNSPSEQYDEHSF